MSAAGFSFEQSSLAVQLHMVAMFAPSFVTGHAFKRLGGPVLSISGAVLLAGGCAVAHADNQLGGFCVSQSLIGLGWNLCFVASTAGLSKQTRPTETARVQAANDMLIFTTSGTCMVLAAPSLAGVGWQSMQWVGYAVSGVIVLAVVLSEALEAFAMRRRRQHEGEGAGGGSMAPRVSKL